MKKPVSVKKAFSVKLPHGLLQGHLCGECLWLDLNEKSGDEYWCAKDRKYYPATRDPFYPCSDFTERR